MSPALVALALQCMGGGPDSAILAPAIVEAVESRARRGLPPVTSSPTEDVCLVGTYMRHESSGMLEPPPRSHDARDLTSCGPLQQQCWRVKDKAPAQLVRMWLHDVAHSSLASVDSLPSRAKRRLDEARDALRGAI